MGNVLDSKAPIIYLGSGQLVVTTKSKESVVIEIHHMT